VDDLFSTSLKEDPAAKQRAIAAVILGLIGGTSAIQPLIAALGDPNQNVRWCAALALAEMGSPARESLTAALESPNKRIRRHAKYVLKSLDEPGTKSHLLMRVLYSGPGSIYFQTLAVAMAMAISIWRAMTARSEEEEGGGGGGH